MLGKWGIGSILFLFAVLLFVLPSSFQEVFAGDVSIGLETEQQDTEMKTCPTDYNLEEGACYSDKFNSCPVGTTDHKELKICVNKNFLKCKTPMELDSVEGVCWADGVPELGDFSCLSGGEWRYDDVRCETNARCPEGYKWTSYGDEGYCSKPRATYCGANAIWHDNRCQISVCGPDQIYVRDILDNALCYAESTIDCSEGFTHVNGDNNIDYCVMNDQCPTGSEPTFLGDCEGPKKRNCLEHMSPIVDNPLVCSSVVTCPSDDTTNADGTCERDKKCPSGTDYIDVTGMCESGATKSECHNYDWTGAICAESIHYHCPTGTGWSGLVCSGVPTCPEGYTKGTFVCFKDGSCPSGAKKFLKVCTADVILDCSNFEGFEELALVCFKEDGACPKGSIWGNPGGPMSFCIEKIDAQCPLGFAKQFFDDGTIPRGPPPNYFPYTCVKSLTGIFISQDPLTSEESEPELPDDGLKVPELSIPDWVKNTAGWWAEKSVDDSDFTGGISYLIEEGIISIPDLPAPTEAAEESVPDWIRNMAGWWADNLTTDQEFADAIKFLVGKGIIVVGT